MQLYLSKPERCGYLSDKKALNLFADPSRPMSAEEYGVLIRSGFRRSGEFVYRPHCNGCSACIPARVPVDQFNPNRSQRRNRKRNQDLTATRVPAEFNAQHFAIYSRYQDHRHPNSSMANASEDDYMRFLTANWSDTRFVEFAVGEQLIGVAVYDVLRDGLSAVYTFFDPDIDKRAPGKYAILWQIEEAKRLRLRNLYLGYWIQACEKMRYKADYQPIEIYQNERWQNFPPLDAQNPLA